MVKHVVWVALILAACTKQDSDNILTRGMYASMTAAAHGDGSTDVSATLYLEDPIQLDFIELQGDDRLVAWQGTSSRIMSESDFLNIVSYHASFDVDAEGTEFRVQFERSVDDGAPDSHGTLPSPFELSTLPAEMSSRAQDLTVTWDPYGPSDPMSWELEGDDCIQRASGAIPVDTGALTILANTIMKKMQQDGQPPVPDTCAATLTIRRSRAGEVDPAFEEGGTFTGVQVRLATFQTVP